MSSLHLTHTQLPDEIISLIAEATVEPFSLKIDNPIDNNDPSNKVTLTGLPTYHLKFISRAFQHGINRGLRNNYTGRLALRVGFINQATRLLKPHGLDWIIPETKHLHLHLLDDNTDLPDETTAYQSYTNLKDVTVTQTRKEMYSDLDYSPVRGKPNNTHNSVGIANRVLKLLQPQLPTDSSIPIVKVVFATGPERTVTGYLNVEVRYNNLSSRLPRATLLRYKTDMLEWDIRSSPGD